MKIIKNYILFLAALSMLFSACKEEEVVDNTLRVAFKEFNGTIGTAEEALTIEVLSSRAADQDLALTIGVSGACSAVLEDYVFTDEANNPISLAGDIALNLTIPAGATSTSFTVRTAENAFPVGTEELNFALLSVENAQLNDSHLLYEVVIGTGSGFFPIAYTNGFENCVNSIPNDFNLSFAAGSKTDRTWSCKPEGNNSDNAIVANAFGGATGIVDAWLITQRKLDFSATTTATISLDVKSEFVGNGLIEFLWSSDYCGAGEPVASEWTNLTALEAQLPEKGSKSYVTISANITSIIGESGYFAMRFTGASNDNSTAYAFDNFKLGATSTGGGGNGGGTGSKLSTDFEDCSDDFAVPSNFNLEFLSSKTDRGWGCRGFGIDNSRAVQASAFGGEDGDLDAWLITAEALDFTSLSEVNLQFQIYSNFSGVGEVIVQYSTDYSGTGSPSAANWTALGEINNSLPAAGSQTWEAINTDLSELGGKTIYLAFQFTGANSGASSSWAIDNFAINDPEVFNGGGGNGGGSGTAITQFDTDFETCSSDYATPAGFIEEFLTAKEDRGWGCRAFGLADSRAVQASGFGGADGEDHAWLIFKDQFDFTGETTVNVLFSIFSNYTGPGQVIMKYSTDYSGTGKPDAATWTAINAVNSAMPAAGSQAWVEINENISELGGKTVYLAFEFVGANNTASSSWAIDNLAINNPAAFN